MEHKKYDDLVWKIMDVFHDFNLEYNKEDAYYNRPLERRNIKRHYAHRVMEVIGIDRENPTFNSGEAAPINN